MSLHVSILTPTKPLFEGEAVSVKVPGALGSFQVLKDHAPLVSTLDTGIIELVVVGSSVPQTFSVKGGVVEVLNNKVSILTEGA